MTTGWLAKTSLNASAMINIENVLHLVLAGLKYQITKSWKYMICAVFVFFPSVFDQREARLKAHAHKRTRVFQKN
jgi:hypothetical protein